MTIKPKHTLAGLCVAMLGIVGVSGAQAGKNGGLDARQEAIVPIAAFTASGDFTKPTQALNQGLDAGLTVNEIKEVLVQL